MSFASRRRLGLVIAVAMMLAVALPSTGFAGVTAQAVFAPDGYEPGDDATATAKVLPAQSYHTLESSTTVNNWTDDVDWFMFSVPATGPVYIVASPFSDEQVGEDPELRMMVYNSSTATGALGTTPTALWSGGSNWSNSSDGVYYFNAVSTPGTYYAKIYDDNDRDTQYNLYVTVGGARRVYGSNRYNTAVALSQDAWADGEGTIILATGEIYADALAAGNLGFYNYVPILLTPRTALPAAVKAEIVRLGGGTIYIMGGTAAISSAVENDLKSMASVNKIKRFAGTDRYGTAALFAREVTATSDLGVGLTSVFTTGGVPLTTTSTVPTVFVASGVNFADALTAGPIAGAANATFSVTATDASTAWFMRRDVAPVLLTAQSALSSPTSQYLAASKARQVYVCGGSTAVATSVVTAIQSVLPSATVTRIAGTDRYDTSNKLATHGRTNYGMDTSSTALVSGGSSNWPDGLAAASFAGWFWQPVLLTQPTTLSASVTAYYKDVDGWDTGNTVIGGPAALSATTFNAFRDLWKTPIN